MKFSVAVKGADVSKDIGCCDTFLIFEEKRGRIIMRQNIENPGHNPDSLPGFLEKFKIEALFCGDMDERTVQAFAEKEIRVVTDVSGKADKVAEEFAMTAKQQANMKSCLQPLPKILVSCRGLNGENNVLAVAYCGNCSYAPPMVMVGIVPTRYSYPMIKESGCFVVNLVDKKYKETFDYLGSHSKRDEDKLAAMNVRLQDGKKVNAPILPDCPVNFECTVVDSIMTGSHEMFIGKVEYVHADAKLLDSEGNIDFSQIDFL
jgi:flavin reductase (DIM6/NTAB) family NADH-FMN oxidoreductase RutF